MKKILILGDYLNTSPNMGCIMNIVSILQKNKMKVHVLSLGNPDKDGHIFKNIKYWFIKDKFMGRMRSQYIKNPDLKINKYKMLLGIIIHRILCLLMLPFYPLSSLLLLKSYFFKVKRLHEKYDYDAVLSVYKPFETLLSTFLLKKLKISNFKLIFYLLDALGDVELHDWLPIKFVNYIENKWERLLFKQVDLLLLLRSHEEHYKSLQKINNKIEFIDIPYIDGGYDQKCEIIKNNWIYAGSLHVCGRNSVYLCKIVTKYNSILNNKSDMINLDLYGVDYKNKLKKFLNDNIKLHNIVSKDVVLRYLCLADILVVLGQNLKYTISSKIIECINLRKKIIYFYHNDFDGGLSYIKKYPYVLLIDERESIKRNIDKICEFMKKDINISDFDLVSIFKENTPEFTVNKILEVMN
jgi:hypothetical protein